MTDRIETKALRALAARGSIAPDRAINMDTLEAASAAPALAAEVLELRAMRDAVGPAVGSMYQSAKASFDEYELVIEHLGDLLAYQIDRADKAETELSTARAEIGRLLSQAEDRIHDC